jgi:hypothetical protein
MLKMKDPYSTPQQQSEMPFWASNPPFFLVSLPTGFRTGGGRS